jgi:hypothetical protein
MSIKVTKTPSDRYIATFPGGTQIDVELLAMALGAVVDPISSIRIYDILEGRDWDAIHKAEGAK